MSHLQTTYRTMVERQTTYHNSVGVPTTVSAFERGLYTARTEQSAQPVPSEVPAWIVTLLTIVTRLTNLFNRSN